MGQTIKRNLLTSVWVGITIHFCQLVIFAQSCGQVEYQIIATTKAATLEKELNEAAKQGFRFEQASQAFGISTLTVLLLRPLGVTTDQLYEYKALSADNLIKQKQDLLANGFVYRASFIHSGLSLFAINRSISPFLLWERAIGVPPPSQDYELMVEKDERKWPELLAQAKARGFSPVGVLTDTILLKRGEDEAGVAKREYRLLSTYKISTLEKEINLAGQEGFHFVTSSFIPETLLVREEQAAQTQYEYKLASLGDSEKAIKQLNTLSSQGFVFRGVTQGGAKAIMERSHTGPSPINPQEFKVLQTHTKLSLRKELKQACVEKWKPLNLNGGSGGFILLLSRDAKI